MRTKPAWMAMSIALLLAAAACTASPEREDARLCEGDADCAQDTRCYRGYCVAIPDAGPICGNEDETLCDGECVDLDHSKDHCGDCNHPCSEDERCEQGLCED